MSTLFKKIIDRQIPADIVYEDEHCLAFRDINPQAPVHVLVIPKQEIATLAVLKDADALVMGRLMVACANVAREQKIEKDGYRVVINAGEAAGQTVFHIHA